MSITKSMARSASSRFGFNTSMSTFPPSTICRTRSHSGRRSTSSYRRSFAVTGIETHVCVQQTTLDLLSMDYQVFVCADAVGSRAKLDHKIGLKRMRQAGAIVTTVESALFELCEECGTSRFKEMLKLIKEGTKGNG